jgi:enoyl-CoA hydratase/carnithine racemase
MLALAHDERVMRADRGHFCLPEVDIKISFSPGMSALISARLSPRTAHEAMTTGRRYGGIEAEQAGIVKDAVPSSTWCQAIELAGLLAAKDPAALATIKQRLYAKHARSAARQRLKHARAAAAARSRRRLRTSEQRQ